MAYYTKKEISDLINNRHEENKKNNINSATPIERVKNQIETEEDFVFYMWFDDEERAGTLDEEIKAKSFSFFRVDFDIYTDDRFAIDLYNACKNGKTVSDIIKEREELQKDVNKTKDEFTKSLKKIFKGYNK